MYVITTETSCSAHQLNRPERGHESHVVPAWCLGLRHASLHLSSGSRRAAASGVITWIYLASYPRYHLDRARPAAYSDTFDEWVMRPTRCRLITSCYAVDDVSGSGHCCRSPACPPADPDSITDLSPAPRA